VKENKGDHRAHDRRGDAADALCELRQRVVIRAAALVRTWLTPRSPRARAKSGRNEEGAGAAADVEQRRGQQWPQQPCAVQVRLRRETAEQIAQGQARASPAPSACSTSGRAEDEGDHGEGQALWSPSMPGEPETESRPIAFMVSNIVRRS
jgi:hypothetical protein